MTRTSVLKVIGLSAALCILTVGLDPVWTAAKAAAPPEEALASTFSRALLFVQNEELALQFPGVSTDEGVVVIVRDLRSFVEHAVGGAPWDLAAVILEPSPRERGRFVRRCEEACRTIAAYQAELVVLVAEEAGTEADPIDTGDLDAQPGQARRFSSTGGLHYAAWLADSHVSARFTSSGAHRIIEAEGEFDPLLVLGERIDTDRFDSTHTAAKDARGPGSPWCCLGARLSCGLKTGSNMCNVALFKCLFRIPGHKPCHHFDGICSDPPGGDQFWICDNWLCAIFDCDGCNSGPGNEDCSPTAAAMGCTGGSCP